MPARIQPAPDAAIDSLLDELEGGAGTDRAIRALDDVLDGQPPARRAQPAFSPAPALAPSAAPARQGGGNAQPTQEPDSLQSLEELLGQVERGDWDADGLFTDGRARQPKKQSACTDWSKDRAGAFSSDPARPVYPSAAPTPADPPDVEEEEHEAAKQPFMSDAMKDQVSRLKTALENTHKKLDKSRQGNRELQERFMDKQKELKEIEEQKALAEKEAARIQAKADEELRNTRAKSRVQNRRKWMNQVLPDAGDEEDDDMVDNLELENTETDPIKRWIRSLLNRYKRFKWHADAWWAARWPLARDCKYVEARYGSSISVYFFFSRWVVETALTSLLFWLPLIVLPHILNLVGGADLPDSSPLKYVYFSGFSTSVKDLYSAAVLGGLVWYVVASFSRFATTMRGQIYANIFQTNMQKMPFSRALLTSWDVAVSDRSTREQMPLAIIENLRALKYSMEWRELAKHRSKDEWQHLRTRRIYFVYLHVILQVSMWVAIVVVTIYSADLGDWVSGGDTASNSFVGTIISLLPALLITSLNMVMPTMNWIIANAAAWDNPESTRRHKIVGFFLGRSITLVIIFVSYFNMFVKESPVASHPLDFDWFSILSEPRMDGYICPQDQFTYTLLLQIAVEFSIPKVTWLAWVHFKRFVMRMQRKTIGREIFLIEKRAIGIIYLQALCWMVTPFCPPFAPVMCLLLWCDFKFDQFALNSYCGKSKKPFKAGGGVGFMIFYVISLVIFVMIFSGLWLASPAMTDCFEKREEGDDSIPDQEGPFVQPVATGSESEKSPLTLLREGIQSGTPWINSILSVVFQPFVLLILLLLMMQNARVRRYRVEALQDYQVEAGTSLVQARARIVQLEKQCDRLRKVDQRIRQSILKMQADDD